MDKRINTMLEKFQILFNYKVGNIIPKINQVLSGEFHLWYYYRRNESFIKDKNQVLLFYLIRQS